MEEKTAWELFIPKVISFLRSDKNFHRNHTIIKAKLALSFVNLFRKLIIQAHIDGAQETKPAQNITHTINSQFFKMNKEPVDKRRPSVIKAQSKASYRLRVLFWSFYCLFLSWGQGISSFMPLRETRAFCPK